jgi:hypothetical protein
MCQGAKSPEGLNMKSMSRVMLALFLSVFVIVGMSGCATTKPYDQAYKPYTGEPEIHEGAIALPFDFLGNVVGSIGKLVYWNHRFKLHNVSDETLQIVESDLSRHPELGNLRVNVNRWAPWESFARLASNDGVDARWRWSFGFIRTLLFEVILPNRIFGYDSYDPYTHTIHLYSDDPALALLQVHKAKHYAERRFRGTKAASRLFLLPDWAIETAATEDLLDELKAGDDRGLEHDAYRSLHPAVGNYPGQHLLGIGNVAGALMGHSSGRYEVQRSRERHGIPTQQAGPFDTSKQTYETWVAQ